MCLTVDAELTREVRELLAERQKVVVYKRPQLLPSADPERRSLRATYDHRYVYREGWNEAESSAAAEELGRRRHRAWFPRIPTLHQDPDDRPEEPPKALEVRHGERIAEGILHAWLHPTHADDPYVMGLEGHLDDFVAAGVYDSAGQVQVGFRRLYLPMAEHERMSKLPIPVPAPAQDQHAIQAQLQALLAGGSARPAIDQSARGTVDRYWSMPAGALGTLFGGAL